MAEENKVARKAKRKAMPLSCDLYLQKESDKLGNLKEPQDIQKTIWSLHNSASPAPSPSCQPAGLEQMPGSFGQGGDFSFTQNFPRYFKLM